MRCDQSLNAYKRCFDDMKKYGYVCIYLPDFVKKHCQGDVKRYNCRLICFVSREEFKLDRFENKFVEFHPCKVCKGNLNIRLHSLEECPNVMCHICKEKGHLTRRCKKAKCSRCGGNHLTSRCKTVKCFKCKKRGHVASRCRNK